LTSEHKPQRFLTVLARKVSPPVAEVKPLMRLFSDEDALSQELKNIHAFLANRAAPVRPP
jgi:hypothetical protein